MSDLQTELFERSKNIAPGGVHSPVRSFKGLPITPRFFKSAAGAMITDVDGVEYIDFCMSFGPLILGHRHPEVERQLGAALSRGWSYGACEPYSLELAEFLLERLPHAEKLRFVNSGTEAVMTAIRLARGYTGRDKVIKFNGCYHGHLDSMLIKAGSGLAGSAEASSAGVPEGVARDTLILDLADEAQVRACFDAHPGQIAAVIIEPLPANNGLLPQTKQYLQFLREITAKNGALLIFDEVISGMRVSFDGMAGLMGIRPDLATYGKIIGGGLPVGAVAGPKEILDQLAPLGRVYQAGTLSANPLAMVGGLATLKHCDQTLYEKLEKNTSDIVRVFNGWLQGHNNGQFKDFQIVQRHSLFWFVKASALALKSIVDLNHIPATLATDFNPLFMELLRRRIYLAPNAYEVSFVSAAHDGAVLKELEKRLGS